MGNLIGWIVRRFDVSEATARIIAMAGLFLVLLAMFGIAFNASRCSSNRQKAAQSRVATGQGAAASNSAADAIATQGVVNGRETASENLTRSNAEDIRSAPGASDKVNPAAANAGITALCKRKAYENSPRCRRP